MRGMRVRGVVVPPALIRVFVAVGNDGGRLRRWIDRQRLRRL